jgi:hypothetical protein
MRRRRMQLRSALKLGLAVSLLLGATIVMCPGCANYGKLTYVPVPVSIPADSAKTRETKVRVPFWSPLFADTAIGFVPGTADTTRRFLGRLRTGFTADTLNVLLFGDNRPAYRTTRLKPELTKLKNMFSFNPVNWAKGLITIPVVLVKGMYPDLALIRDIPSGVRRMPTYGREKQVLDAMVAKLDSLEKRGQVVAAAINTGDLIKDGRRPAHWERFLDLTRPLSSRVPYFAVAGNHERTDTQLGVDNWRVATGLPVSGDRLYYCFDSADGWVRFIALDTNPMVNPQKHWSREVEIKYSDEQIDWAVARVKEHVGPVFIFMHHPPFSSGYHRDEWQYDAVMRERRQRMVQALHDTGISILASGHEHSYQRALITWPDAVLINIATGGAGSPLVVIPSQKQSAAIMSEYKVAGSVIKPENVFTAQAFHFILIRLWFGGGEFYTYDVDKNAKTKVIDKVEIDLKRYGTPEIDQHKMIVPPKGPTQPPEEPKAGATATTAAKTDTTATGKQLLNQPPPGNQAPPPRPTPKKKPTSKSTDRSP